MLTIGVDAHKRLHVAQAVDSLGRPVADWTGQNTEAEWQRFVDWLTDLGEPVQVGVEGAGSYGRGLALFLVARQVTVFDVSPRLTARHRRHAPQLHKSDEADALVIARIVLRDCSRLPRVVEADASTAELTLLTQEREQFKQDATRLRNRLHAALLQLNPSYQRDLPTIDTRKAVLAVLAYEPPLSTSFQALQLASIKRIAAHLERLLTDIDELGARIAALGQLVAPALVALYGISGLSAGMVVGLVGSRVFQREAQFAAFAGVSPIEASSAGRSRHRLNRLGTRPLNAIIHRIAFTQARGYEPAKTYMAMRQRQGLSYREALRCLKRYVAREIFNRLRQTGVHAAPRPSFA